MSLIPAAISSRFARQILVAQKNSPSLLFGAGIAGVVGSTVLACRATLKVERVLDEIHENLEQVKDVRERAHVGVVEYSPEDAKRDTVLIYVRGATRIALLYAPAILLGGAAIASLTQAHSILTKRNAALTAAYAAIEKGFNEYRGRVIEKFGEEQDREFRYGTEKVAAIDEETGRRITIEQVRGDGDPSIYSRFFDEYNPNWSKTPEYNKLFLKNQQNYANDMLRARGHLFLNEVYDMLGMERSRAGQVVGWVIGDEGGDNYVDFGIFEERNRNFIHGLEGSILLDFNVDGVIWALIDQREDPIRWQA